VGLIVLIPLAVAAVAAGIIAAVRLGRAAVRRAEGVQSVGGLRFKADLYYAPGHTWLAQAGSDKVKVGLDDLATRLLPNPSEVQLPKKGQELKKGEVAAVVHCGSRRVEIAAPVTGKVTAINMTVARQPDHLRDAYGTGWLFQMEPADAEFARMTHGTEVRPWMDAEGTRLLSFIEHHLGVASADGGEFLLPAAQMLRTISGTRW
jgi:glycine cleavage system H lipoate-binding protein